jgi:predicted glutamine amidotransferase
MPAFAGMTELWTFYEFVRVGNSKGMESAMCRLLGIYGQVDFWQEIVLGFRRQAEFGNIPPVEDMEPGHQDGWGMARSRRDKTAMVPIIRRLGSAWESTRYRQAVTSMDEVPDVFLGHLRKASDGIPVTLANAHPFFHDGWAFIHNGTVYGAESLPRDASLIPTSDDSDAEYLFHYLLSALMTKPVNKGIGVTLAMAVSSLKAEYTAVNSMLSNGHDLYVISGYKKWQDYYTLHCYSLPTGVIISSQPIESSRLDPTSWSRLANNSLLRIHGSPPRIDRIPIANAS